jgi:poly-gamma-glutamate capsule biosynthesis protein CapA/YwtB (metallophosphatase superfamily)
MLRLRTLTLILPFLLVACQPRHTAGTKPAVQPTASFTVLPTRGPDPNQPATVTVTVPVATLTRVAPTATRTIVPSPTASPTSTHVPVTTLLFTGVIVPARCVQAQIDATGDTDYIYDEVRGVIQQADLAVGTFNATMSDFPPHTGCVPTYVLVGGSGNADAMQRAGFDVMSVATNHIKDCGITTCGDRAFFDTLNNLKRVGILAVGAGKNLEEAMLPVVVTLNGVRFGIVSLGQIEQGGVYATADKAGIAVLTEENVKIAIQAARQVSDVVIVMPHWGPEDVSTPNWIQRNLAHVIVEAGADLVVGNHTHVVQGIQEIDGIPVFYGLGNFVFDQWRRTHQQAVILKVSFEGTRYIGYELVPTHVDGDGRVHIAAADEAAEILEGIRQASQGLK